MQQYRNKRNSSSSVLLLIGMLLQMTVTTNAAEVTGLDTLITLEEAVDFAISRGLIMRTAVNRYQTSEISLFSAKQALLPTARATLSTSCGQSHPYSAGSFSAGASVGANYELAPSRFLQYKSGKIGFDASQFDIDQQRNDIAAKVIVLYVKAIGASKLIEVQQDNVGYQQRKLAEIDAFFHQGIKAHSDVLQQHSNAADAQVNLLKSMQEYQRIRYSLLDMLGLPLADKFRFDSIMVTAMLVRFSIDTVLRFTPVVRETDEIKAQRLRVESAEALLAGSRLGYVPAFSVSAGWSVQGRTSTSSVNSGSGGTSNGVDIGASVGIPVFDQQQRAIKVKNAEIAVVAARLELERLQRTADLAVKQAMLDDTMGNEMVASATIRYESAGEALLAMEERYKSGTSTLTELNAVQAGCAESKSALVQARFERIVNRINLFHATGRMGQVIGIVTKPRQ